MSELSCFSTRRVQIRRFGLACITIAGIISGAVPALAEDRLALVIGNGDYAHIEPLEHVDSDVAVMADTLRSLDFDVEAVRDLDRRAMAARLAAFGQRLDRAGQEAVGLIFYAGHGFQLDGSSYLLPVDADIAAAGDVDRAAINLDLTLAEIAFAAGDHKLVIVDVPTTNGLVRKIGASAGLAAVDAPVGTLVAYGALSPVGDLEPRHRGLYPLALANVMATPGLTVEEVFQEVRLNVAAATDGVQVPWETSALRYPVYLADLPEGNEGATIAESGSGGPSLPYSIDPRTVDLVFWTGIEGSGNPTDFADYLKRFPDGVFRNLAEHRLAELADVDMAADADLEPAYRIEDRDQQLITQRRANVRAEPGSHGVIVATIEQGQTLHVSGEVVDRDWLRVRLGDEIDAFVRAPLLGASPPSDDTTDLASTLPPSKSALLGRWHGEYRCQWDTIGLTLDIVDRDLADGDGIEAIFSFFPLPGTPAFSPGSYTMAGDYDPEDGTLLLESRDWIEHPPGQARHDLAGRAAIGGTAIAGRIETPGCGDFSLERADRKAQSMLHSVSVQ